MEDEGGNLNRVTSAAEIQRGLQEYWAPVYMAKEMDRGLAKKFLVTYRHRNFDNFHFSALSMPDEEVYLRVISRARDSACGVDGIPYSGYQASALLSASV